MINFFQFFLEIFVPIILFLLIILFLSLMVLFFKRKLCHQKKCCITIKNHLEKKIIVERGQNLLSVLENNNINIPTSCAGKGICKGCRIQIIENCPVSSHVDKLALDKNEITEGFRLSCQCRVKDDMTILLNQDILNARNYQAKVISNNNISPLIKELELQIEDNFIFNSGDFVRIHVPPNKTDSNGWKSNIDENFWNYWNEKDLFNKKIDNSNLFDDEIIRSYSIASTSSEQFIKFFIKLALPFSQKGKILNKKWGIASSYLFSLKKDQIVKISGPFGNKKISWQKEGYIFLIGGVGISFARSIIIDLLKNKKSNKKILLFYGCRCLDDAILQEEFKKLEKEFKNFKYFLVLSHPTEEDIKKGWDLNDKTKTNFLFKSFEKQILSKSNDFDNYLYLICGPEKHNLSCISLLEEYDIPKKNIIIDECEG